MVSDPTDIYLRIEKAYRKDRGVRLTAEEVAVIYTMDDAIFQACQSAHQEQEPTDDE